MQLCRVGISTEDSTRNLTATIITDPLANYNIYYKSIYKGSGSSYGNMSDTDPYLPLPTSGILLSQGLWEIKVVLANKVDNPAPSISVSDSEKYPNGSSGVIFINLNTTTITVKLESGDGYAQITSYQLTGNVPSSPSVTVQLFKYNDNGSTFDSITGTAYSGFINETSIKNNVFTNKKTSLPAGIYYVVLTVESPSLVTFVDTIAFVVRTGLTTSISGSCNTFNEISSSNNGGYLVGPVIPVNHDKETTENVHNITSDNYNNTSDNQFTKIETNHIYTFDTSKNALPHVDNKIEGARIPTPEKDTKFAINLNGADISISMAKQGNTTNESAIFTSLQDGVLLTIYNYNKDAENEGTFVNVKNESAAAGKIGKRLQTTINIDGPELPKTGSSSPTLNIVGNGALGEVGLSNGKVIFSGPHRDDCEEKKALGTNETKQGTINLSGSGGNITLDGEVEVQGFVGISSWKTTLTNSALESTINQTIFSTIQILNNARINVIGDKEIDDRLSDDAQGIAIYADQSKSGGKISIILDNNGSILTNCESANAEYAISNPEAGILIDGFVGGELNITITNNSKIDSTNGHGIVLRNCRGTRITIECDNTSYIYGKLGAIFADSTCTNMTVELNNNTINSTEYTKSLIGTK